MKMKLTVAAALVALVSPTYAASYILSNVITGEGGSDALIQKADNSLLSGGIAAMGFFPKNYTVSTNISDIATTIAAFTLGTPTSFTAVGLASASLGGSFPGYMEVDKIAGPTYTGTNDMIGRPVYLFVGNASTLALSTEWALKQIGTYADDVPNDQEYLANPKAGVAPVLGTIGAYTGNASGAGSSSYQTLKMVAIPEASTALLGALGALGLLRRRR